MLASGETTDYKLPPQLNGGRGNYVRTGTVGDGSCFFHAVFFAHSPSYANKPDDKKGLIVQRLRRRLEERLTKQKWASLGSGAVAVLDFQIQLNKLLESFHQKEKEGLEDLIAHAIPYKVLDEKVLPSAYENSDTLEKCKVAIMERAEEYLQSQLESVTSENGALADKAKRLHQKATEWLESMIASAEDRAFKKFSNKIRAAQVDDSMIEYVSDFLGQDIAFIDFEENRPYKRGGMKGRPMMVLIWIGRSHYEVLGRLSRGRNGEKCIERIFPKNDPLTISFST